MNLFFLNGGFKVYIIKLFIYVKIDQGIVYI